MEKKTYTREEVIKLIDEILENPDQVLDAIENEMTDWTGEELLNLVENQNS